MENETKLLKLGEPRCFSMKTGKEVIKDLIKVYRVSISGMYGEHREEKFYRTKTFAEIKFGQLIGKKRDEKNTLDDDTFSEEGYGNKNFEKDSTNDNMIESVKYGYGSNESDENGTEFYSYCDTIILEEIELDCGETIHAVSTLNNPKIHKEEKK